MSTTTHPDGIVTLDKIIRPGTVAGHNLNGTPNPALDVFCRIRYAEGRLSITGVIGPMPSGNAKGGCGQIDMEFSHRNLADNDKCYSSPLKPVLAPGWDRKTWLDFLDVWKAWHLNDMRSGCEHQRAMGWTYEAHHNPATFKGDDCPTCGHSIGSAWLKEEVPAEVLAFLDSLPDADKRPAWC